MSLEQKSNPLLHVKGQYIFTLQMSITSKCNLQCLHCYDDAKEHVHMPVDQCIAVLDTFFAFCNKWNRFPRIWITGGEPTIHPFFWDILDYIQEKVGQDCFVTILSNGTTITEEFVKKVKMYSMRIDVQVSVDGACAKVHDSIRGKGTFEKAVTALKIMESTDIITHLHFVVHKDNYKDGFFMTDLAKQLGVNVLTVTRLVPWGRGKELYEKMLTPEQVQRLYKKLSDDYDEIVSVGYPPNLHIARDRCDWPIIYVDPATEEAFTKNGHKCGAAQSYINVMENGDVYPCRRLPIVVGNIFKEDFIKIWQHPFMWKLRQKHEYMKGKCKDCYFCAEAPHVCSGGATCIAYACYKDPFQPDPQCGLTL
jgi:radical SAM protein with 4Fe4S-binding SPASM domain